MALGPVLPAVARQAEPQILLVGIDSADWDLIDPLSRRGELPNLTRLRAEGAWAVLRSDSPTLSPLLWTTAVTGHPKPIAGKVGRCQAE